jgi:zinc transport system permease protein
MDNFLWRALLGGIGVALVTGPFGCFVIWRRMAYFGETLAHAGLLGVALGFLLGSDLNFSVITVCITIAMVLVILQQQKRLATDTALGILAHSTLSLGLVTLAFVEGLRVDLMAYLFGDLLALTVTDLYWIYGGGGISLLCLTFIWPSLLSMTVHEELAQVEGVHVVWVRLLFMLTVALVVAIAMKIVGILLITSLLIIPPATARYFAHTPEQMAGLSSLIGCLAVAMGLYLSWSWDTPTGPAVVVAATLMFVMTLCLPVRRQAG